MLLRCAVKSRYFFEPHGVRLECRTRQFLTRLFYPTWQDVSDSSLMLHAIPGQQCV